MTYIPYGKQNINSNDIKAVNDILKSDFLTQGKKVGEFENALSKYLGVKYVTVVNSGTSALHLAYLAMNLKKGDEVITTPNTFVATTNMLLAIGAKPVFCDIRPDTYNIDEKKIIKLITPKTKAIVPVHFAGQPCEMNSIFKIAKKYNLRVIEDAAHALGAKYHKKRIGSLASDATCFSFHAIKPITTGEGGAITTNNKNVHKKLMLLRSHGITKNKNSINVMKEMGFNYRLSDIQCALGISQLDRLDQFLLKRQEIANLYKKELADVREIILPIELKNNTSGWHIFVILAQNKVTKKALAKFMLTNKIGVNYHYPPVFTQPYYQKLGYKKTLALKSQNYFSRCLTLPIHTKITHQDIIYITSKIKHFYKNNMSLENLVSDKL